MIFRLKLSHFRNFSVNRNFCVKTSNSPREIKLDTPSGRIAAKVWNESGSKTPIIAFHGWLDNAGTFDNLCPLLDKDFPVYAVDFPGHGYSYHPPLEKGLYFTDFVVYVHRIIYYLRFKKVILLGHSLGGNASLIYTGTLPDVVDKLIMIDIIGPSTTEFAKLPEGTANSLRALLKIEQRNPDEKPRYSYEEIVQKLIKGYDFSVNEDAAKILLIRNSRRHEDGKYSFTSLPNLLRFELRKEHVKSFTSRVNCDFLIIKSPTSDFFSEKKLIKEYLNCYRKSSRNFVLEIMEGTHHLHLMTPVPVAESINNFLHGKGQSAESKAKTDFFLSNY